MEIEPGWQKRFPRSDIKGAISFLDSLDWYISYHKLEHSWELLSGDKLIISTDTEKESEAFILGMALSLAVLPDEVLNEIRRIIRE
jgi:hypothetical protein